MFVLLPTTVQKKTTLALDGTLMVELFTFCRATGLAQDDNPSPLFSVLSRNLPDRIKTRRKVVEVILYADRLALQDTSKRQVKQALTKFYMAVTEMRLLVNLDKTEAA